MGVEPTKPFEHLVGKELRRGHKRGAADLQRQSASDLLSLAHQEYLGAKGPLSVRTRRIAGRPKFTGSMTNPSRSSRLETLRAALKLGSSYGGPVLHLGDSASNT